MDYLAIREARKLGIVLARQMELAQQSAEVRGALARNPSLDATLVERLACDSSPGVRAAIASRRAGARPPSSLATDHHRAVRLALARNPAFEGPLTDLVQDEWEPIRRALARHPRAFSVASRLLMDASRFVRQAAALNPQLDPKYLALLLTDEDLNVRRAAAANPYTPAERLDLMRALTETVWLESFTPFQCRSIQIDEEEHDWLLHSGAWGRRLLAANDCATEAALRELTDDPDKS